MTTFTASDTGATDSADATSAGLTAAGPTTADTAPGKLTRRTLPGAARMLFHQLKYDTKSQVRNPAAMFFTMILPVVFVVIFSVTSGDTARAAAYFVPAMMVLAIASGTLTNTAVTLTYLREYGQLKRVLVTPVPRSSYLGSRLVSGGLVSLIAVLILAAVGGIAFDALPATAPDVVALVAAMLAVLVTGSCLGLATTTLIRSENAAAPLANAISLPLLLASGVFFPLDSAPSWFADVAALLPFTPAVDVATAAYDGTVSGQSLLELGLVTGAWTLIATGLTWRLFRWAPTRRR